MLKRERCVCQEVKKSLAGLSRLQQDHDSIMSATCQLSDQCISAVQNMPRHQFLNSYPQFLDSVQELEHRVERMQSAEDQMPAFLRVPFSLHKEKLHLHNALQFSAFNLQGIRAREHQRFVPSERLMEEVTVHTLLETPLPTSLPPSSTLRYNVDIYCGSKHTKAPVWSSKKAVHGGDVIINGGDSHGLQLVGGSLYVVKIRPLLSCTTHLEEQTTEGRLISIVIVTDKVAGSGFMREPVLASGDSHLVVSDTHSLLNGSFESRGEDALSCVNLAAMGNKNNSSSRTRGARRIIQTQEPNTIRQSSNAQAASSRPPSVDPLFPPALPMKGGPRGLSSGSREHFAAAPSTNSRPTVPIAKTDVAFPVPSVEPGNLMCIQNRYAAGCCSFEEARLAEDSTLQMS